MWHQEKPKTLTKRQASQKPIAFSNFQQPVSTAASKFPAKRRKLNWTDTQQPWSQNCSSQPTSSYTCYQSQPLSTSQPSMISSNVKIPGSKPLKKFSSQPTPQSSQCDSQYYSQQEFSSSQSLLNESEHTKELKLSFEKSIADLKHEMGYTFSKNGREMDNKVEGVRKLAEKTNIDFEVFSSAQKALQKKITQIEEKQDKIYRALQILKKKLAKEARNSKENSEKQVIEQMTKLSIDKKVRNEDSEEETFAAFGLSRRAKKAPKPGLLRRMATPPVDQKFVRSSTPVHESSVLDNSILTSLSRQSLKELSLDLDETRLDSE